LRVDGMNGFVRHPLYTGLLVVLWSRVFDEFQLASALWGTAYIIIGTRFEERKLLRLYGESYLHYRQAVPTYFPWRGRYRPEA
jgi:protein-S-isoprenylcysteine O-methyltransferase Ste14